VFKQKQKTNGGRHYRNPHCFEMKVTMLSSHALVYIKGDYFLFGLNFIKKSNQTELKIPIGFGAVF
jgi:hypothetical protein